MSLLIIMGIGGVYLIDKLTEHERQVAFLKEHKAEIVQWVKNNEKKYDDLNVDEVMFDWNSVKYESGMAFQEKSISVYIETYDKEDKNLNGFTISVYVDKGDNPKMIKEIH